MLIKSKLCASEIEAISYYVGQHEYAGNVYADRCEDTGRTRSGLCKVRFTIATRDAWARGSRTSPSGRHMKAASWEAHRDVLAAIFEHDGNAEVQTAFTTYTSREHFERTFPNTQNHNVGSIAEPCRIVDTSV